MFIIQPSDSAEQLRRAISDNSKPLFFFARKAKREFSKVAFSSFSPQIQDPPRRDREKFPSYDRSPITFISRRGGIRLREVGKLEGRPSGGSRPWILGIHPLDYEVCGNCPEVVAPGRAPEVL